MQSEIKIVTYAVKECVCVCIAYIIIYVQVHTIDDDQFLQISNL